MSEISLDHYVGREVVRGTSGASDHIVLDGDIKIFNDDEDRQLEEIPKGSRLAMVIFDAEETQVKFIDEDGEYHTLTLTATKHSLSDPERTEGERVVLQGGVDQRDLTVPPEPSERHSEHPIHVEERQKAVEESPEPEE
jgi:hypothetical protein